ncbi:MAG: uracil-DNA glycosylase [Thermoleophilia bacterium]|nr:uracil-DNA glycosylase [Thermoleophilia bacterium]
MSKPEDIYDKHMTRAISEINELCRELTHCERCAHGKAVPVIGSGHPLADIFLVKYRTHPSEASEGVAFFGRSGEAVIKGCQKLSIDSLILYGTNVIKCANVNEPEGRRHCPQYLKRELMIVQPKLVVVMGEETLEAINELDFPLAGRLEFRPGEIQQMTPTIEALITPEIDESLSDQRQKTDFWKAFKVLSEWYESLPPY